MNTKFYVQKFFESFGHGAYDEYNRRLRDFLARDVCDKLGRVLCEDDLFVIGGVDKASLNTVSDVGEFSLSGWDARSLRPSLLIDVEQGT